MNARPSANQDPVPNWSPCPQPPREEMTGQYCSVVPLDLDRHAPALFAANTRDASWDYLAYGPFETEELYRAHLAEAFGDDPLPFAIVVEGRPVGLATYLRIQQAFGSIEVGHINFTPLLQRTRAATEAMHLMMARAFELGYRRYEWKCNAANGPSLRAAERLGFRFEGVHRQAMVVKGCNRDTAWFSILDSEWPQVRTAHGAWLSPSNFDGEGQQQSTLAECIERARASTA